MEKHTLGQLTSQLATDPQLVERLFLYHTTNNKYGPVATAAIAIPETARNYAQHTAVATARTTFGTERGNPDTNEVLLRTYLPTYSQEMNQRNWNRGKNIAIGMGAAGLAFLVWSLVDDAEVAKKVGRMAGVTFEAVASIKLFRDYFRYKA